LESAGDVDDEGLLDLLPEFGAGFEFDDLLRGDLDLLASLGVAIFSGRALRDAERAESYQ